MHTDESSEVTRSVIGRNYVVPRPQPNDLDLIGPT